MHRAAPTIAALAIVLAAVVPAPAAAAGPAPEASAPVIVADLAGTPIPVSAIPSYHCHDRDFPKIHCFTTAAARDLALVTATDMQVGSVQAASASDYAIVFAGATGSSLSFCCNVLDPSLTSTFDAQITSVYRR